MEITARRMQICQFIDQFRNNRGYSPSIRQVCRGVGIKSTSNVWYHFRKMERDGLLKRELGVSRSVVVSPAALSTLARARGNARNRALVSSHAK